MNIDSIHKITNEKFNDNFSNTSMLSYYTRANINYTVLGPSSIRIFSRTAYGVSGVSSIDPAEISIGISTVNLF